MEDGLRNADSVNDLRLRLKLEGKQSGGRDLLEGMEALTVQEDEEEAGMISPTARRS